VLRADVSVARNNLQIIGPWIDHYFADIVTKACPKKIKIRVLTRPLPGMSPDFINQACAAAHCFNSHGGVEFAILESLHAKVIVVDEMVAYCGSANWYRYSLESSSEIVLYGPVASMPTILDEVASLWSLAQPVNVSVFGKAAAAGKTITGRAKEVLDPIAAAKMAQVPGSFILKR